MGTVPTWGLPRNGEHGTVPKWGQSPSDASRYRSNPFAFPQLRAAV